MIRASNRDSQAGSLLRLGFLVWFILSLLAVAGFSQGDFQKGISYYKQGQYARAVPEFAALVKQNPDYEAGYRVLGDCYLKLKQYDRASAAFNRAIELDNTKFVSFYGAAVAEFNMGRHQESVAKLLRGERYAESPRELYQLYNTRGSAYYRLGRYNEAISDLRQAISIQRGRANDALLLGISYFQIGDYTSAATYLEQARALDPDSAEAGRYLARLSFQGALDAIRQQDYAQAISLLEDHVAENPGDGEAWFNLGLAHMYSEDLANAEKAFLLSIQQLPNNWEAYDRLGFIYEMTERYQDSLRSYSRALEIHQDARLTESVERVQERIRRQQNS
jgi:tetratricopeptide (TPR) repeat protein